MTLKLSIRSSRIILTVLAAFLLSLVGFATSGTADAHEGELIIDGSGWGHGIGMSQYGAYARAIDGQSYVEILDFYYDAPGSDLTSVVTDPVTDNFWIGLEQEAVRVVLRPVAISGGGVPVTLKRATATDGSAALTGEIESVSVPINSQIVIDYTADGCTYTIGSGGSSAEGGCNFDIAWDGWELSPTAAVQLVKHWEWAKDPAIASDATACSRWAGTVCTYDQGELRVRPDNNRGLDVSLEVDLDGYISGIAEMPASWDVEALKAQAVAARSFARYTSDKRVAATNKNSMAPAVESRSWCWCTLYDSSDEGASGKVNDQVFRGRVYNVTAGGYGENWRAAVDATRDEIVQYQGSPIGAFYGSSNGGATENNEDIWGGAAIPYLRSRPDPITLTAPGNTYSSWTYTKSTAVLRSKLGLDAVSDVQIVETYDSGTPSRIVVTGTRDGQTVTVDSYLGTPIDGVWIQSWYSLRGAGITGFRGDMDVVAPPPPPPPPPVFSDIDTTIHQASIEYLADRGVALACNDGPDKFCPQDRMRREDLAAFMVRTLNLPATTKDYFHDDDGLAYEADINALAQAGVTKGCNPPDNDEFCPDQTVSRAQTAAFIVRAWNLTDPGPGDWFHDDDSSVFEDDIDRLAQAGITLGCNPPTNDRYCGDRLLTRAEMTSFLARALKKLPLP